MASLTQIAMKAGVSVTAASLVLNKKDHGTRVSDVCARRIREIAAEVGYVPNYHACSIKKGRSDTIAIALDLGIATEDGRFLTRGELAKPYFGLMVGGIEEVMRSRGCMVTIVGPDASSRAPERALIGLRQRRFDGMIIMGTLVNMTESHLLEESPEFPIVVTEPPVATHLTAVDYDERMAVALAVDHLAALGHKRLLWIAPSPRYLTGNRPVRGELLARRCAELGLHSEALEYVVPIDDHGFEQYHGVADAAREAVARRLAGPRSFTGVIAYNDITAVGVVDALTDAGLNVPRDVSVVGHDDFEGRQCRPRLTSVDHRLDEMGRMAAELLVRLIEDPSLEKELRGKTEFVEPRLSVRGSTGPAPAQ